MLIVGGHFDVDPADRDQFIADRIENMRASRAEDGCISYGLMADPIEPGRVVLYERWESPEALAAHLERLGSAPRPAHDIAVLGVEVLRYDIAQVLPLR